MDNTISEAAAVPLHLKTTTTMALRTYTVYLEGGAAFSIKAVRFETTSDGVFFYGENDQPLKDTFINPKSVIAILPPTSTPEGSNTGFLRV